MDAFTAFKVTRADGTDFHSGLVQYAVGATVAVDPVDGPEEGACGRGLHLCRTALRTCRFGNRSIDRGKWRWFEASVLLADLIAEDSEKLRVRRLTVVRELTQMDVFGAELSVRITACRAEAESWKSIRWLKPSAPITPEVLAPILARWYDANAVWRANRGDTADVPRRSRIVRDPSEARKIAAADADADAAAAAAADADAAAAAAAAAAADADDDARWPWGYYRWHVRPYWALRRAARWRLCGLPEAHDPFTPIVELYRLGVMPLGYYGGEFCIYVPSVP